MNKKVVYFSVLYTGFHGFSLKKKIKQLLADHYPQVKINVVFKSVMDINRIFKIKDKVPQDLRSNVIYEYKCVDCNATYVGKCSRHFKTRIYEHLGRSHRTGNYMTKPAYSAIREHCEDSDHRISKENFSILASAKNNIELNIMEALFQHTRKPTLGRPSYDLFCF